MNKQIVALSINKVQSFLFDVILSHTQEKQAEENTLNGIMTASKEISEDFVLKIKTYFGDREIKELLYCSGVYIFQCMLREDCIAEKLNLLFQNYYKESQGKKQLRYVFFPKENFSDLMAIKKAKQLLQKPENFATIVAKNKEILFSFNKVERNGEKAKHKKNYPKFAGDINSLFNLQEADNFNRFRMAVIKADLDGMGDMFKKINDYRHYKAISTILNDFVSLDGLHRTVSKYFPNHKDSWIFPFYVAGDDIFFAVSVGNLITGIDVCRNIIADINNEIQKVAPKYKLSLSVGVEIVFNREPVRYYLDMVENQLKHAKKMNVATGLEPFVHSKIAIAGVVWLNIDMKEIKKYKNDLRDGKRCNQRCKCQSCQKIKVINQAIGSAPIWCFFLDEVAILNYVKLDDSLNKYVGTSHSFYSLLEKLTNENIYNDNKKYINNLLYHLIPKYLDTAVSNDLWKVELLINRGIIKQLYQKGFKGNCIQINESIKTRLEAYLRLLLLFADKRFHINGIEERKKYNFRQEEQDNIRKELLNKPMEYLYDLLKTEHGSHLLKYFADYKKLQKQGNHLERLSIDKSMFYKMRKTDKVTVKKAAKMIGLQNADSKQEIAMKNAERKKEGRKPQYLFFDEKGFCETAEKYNQWTQEFIDSLMLLYEYNSLLRRYKKRCKDIKESLINE